MTDTERFVWKQARAIAEESFNRLCRDMFTALYVHFVPGALSLDTGELAWAERIPGNLTVDQLTRWIAERANKIPFLPETI